MKLLPEEEEITVSNANKIVLTNYRIQMTDRDWGKSFIVSIFLEDISSIAIKYKSHVLFIILGVVFALAGVYLAGRFDGGILGPGAFILAVLFFALWWFTREHIISISSNGGSAIHFAIKGMADEKVNEFIHHLSLAKFNRVKQLS